MNGKTQNKAFFGKFFERQLSKGELRKAQILEKTIEMIGKVGVENTSFDAVAAAIRVKASHINYYFPTRTSLIEAAIKFVTMTGYEVLNEELSKCKKPKEMLALYITAHFRWLKENPEYLSVMLILFHYATYQKSYKKLMDSIRNRGRERIQEIIRPLHSFGNQRELESSADAIQSLLTGNLIYGFTISDTTVQSELQAETIKAAENLLRWAKK